MSDRWKPEPTCIAYGLPKHGWPEVRHCFDLSGSAHHAKSCYPSCQSNQKRCSSLTIKVNDETLSQSSVEWTLTVHMSHLPVRDVHLLVVAWWERKHHHISSSKDSITICLHHLSESLKGKLTKYESQYLNCCLFCQKLYKIPCWQWWIPWSPCGCCSVSESLLQERFLQSRTMKKGFCSPAIIDVTARTDVKEGTFYTIFAITCSDDTYVCPQDFSTLQHHFFQLCDRKNKVSSPCTRVYTDILTASTFCKSWNTKCVLFSNILKVHLSASFLLWAIRRRIE